MGGGAKYAPRANSVSSVASTDSLEIYSEGSLKNISRADWQKVQSGESVEVQSGGDITFLSGSSMKLGASGVAGYPMVVEGVSFTEDGSGTSYTATVEIPAGAVVHDICFTSTVLWDGTSASLDIGDDDDPSG